MNNEEDKLKGFFRNKKLILMIPILILLVLLLVLFIPVSRNSKKPMQVRFVYNCESRKDLICDINEFKLDCEVTNPICDNQKFVGWYDETGNLVDISGNFDKGTTLYAHYNEIVKEEPVKEEKNYTVTFDSNGGSEVEKQTVEEGKTVIEPEKPIKSDYIFVGWFLDDVEYDFSSEVKSDITLIARWEHIEEVTSNTNMSINMEKSVMKTTETQTLTVSNIPANSSSITWECNNRSLASISSNGVVLAKKPGVVSITARASDGTTATANIKIETAEIVMIGNSKTYRENISSGSVYLELQNMLRNRNFDVNLNRISKGGSSLYQKANNLVEDADFTELWNKKYDKAILQEDYKYVPNTKIDRPQGYYEGVNATITKLKQQNPNITLYLRDGYYKYVEDLDSWYKTNRKGINNSQTIAQNLNMIHIEDGTALLNYVEQYVQTSENLKSEFLEAKIENKKHLKPKGAYLIAACIYKKVTSSPATDITYYAEGLIAEEAQTLLIIANGC